ncbi:MAG: rane protein of unknown function [Candidatus Solibacter sp.]|jgi:hypothetical protein|nr:rane protein of unknown function [Candidatus Solibacter sp.]
MHYRRIVCFILGVWFGGGLIMAWYGSRSFGTVNDIVNSANPALVVQTKPLGPVGTRQVLRYAIAEQNRWMFKSWEMLQIALGLLFFSYLLFGTTEGKFTLAVSLAMVFLTLLQRFGISPELGVVGRSMDYVPAEFVTQEHAKFWLLHNAYLGVDALKYGLGIILGAIAMSRKRSNDPLNQFNMIDKANHRHVNW